MADENVKREIIFLSVVAITCLALGFLIGDLESTDKNDFCYSYWKVENGLIRIRHQKQSFTTFNSREPDKVECYTRVKDVFVTGVVEFETNIPGKWEAMK